MRRHLPTILAIALIAILGAVLVHFRHYSPYKIGRDLVGNPEIILSLHDVEVVGRSHGEKIWSFKAERADVTRGRVRTTFTNIEHGEFYEDKKVAATVQAGQAVYDSAFGDVEVTGGVKIASPRGYRATAQRAKWSAYFRRLTCPGKVSFRAEGSELVGQDLVADMKTEEVTLEKAKMVVSVPEEVK